jgi:hypothetical protein
MMKTLAAFLSVALCTFAQDVEKISEEEAQKVARRIAANFSAPADAPFTVEVDVDKPSGLKGGDKAGIIAIPDKRLTAEVVAATGKEITPVGHLWMYNVVPAVEGRAPEPGKLRSVEFGEGEQKRVVEVYYLGITKTDAGALELGLYAKDKSPLVKVPFVKTDAAANGTSISVSGRKEDENTGVLVVTVFGSYKADITVTKPRE